MLARTEDATRREAMVVPGAQLPNKPDPKVVAAIVQKSRAMFRERLAKLSSRKARSDCHFGIAVTSR